MGPKLWTQPGRPVESPPEPDVNKLIFKVFVYHNQTTSSILVG